MRPWQSILLSHLQVFQRRLYRREERVSTGKVVLSRQEPILGEDLHPGHEMRQRRAVPRLAADRPTHSR